MTINILLITHENIGSAFLNAAKKTFGCLPIATKVFAVSYNIDPENLLPKIKQYTEKLEPENELLILTDLYGSTPCNIALGLQDQHHIQIISGLNLPMLLKVMNYPNLNLDELTKKAIDGGRNGVVDCTSECNYFQEQAQGAN